LAREQTHIPVEEEELIILFVLEREALELRLLDWM
jgi:hypothetical protein